MKKLFFISGTMGVGKTTVCKELMKNLDKCVFLDGDWCWDMNPFVVNSETTTMVQDNICYMLNNFIACSAYENIIFCWVMHQQEIIDSILSNLDLSNVEVINISLVCSEDSLRKRLQLDVNNGIRNKDIIEKSVKRIPLYEKLNTIKIDVSEKSISEIVNLVMSYEC